MMRMSNVERLENRMFGWTQNVVNRENNKNLNVVEGRKK